MIIKNFKFDLVEQKKIIQINTDHGRFYETPTGIYPSVTTMLSWNSDNTWIDEWRRRIGNEKADEIMNEANKRGTKIHDLCEKYIRGELNEKKIMPIYLESFKKCKLFLDKYVDVIKGIELLLYSEKLKIAGKSDLIAEVKGNLAIIDYKTSRHEKKKEDILNYFLQATIYALCFEEMYDIRIPMIVIVIACDNVPDKPLVFIENKKDYIGIVKDMCENGKRNSFIL